MTAKRQDYIEGTTQDTSMRELLFDHLKNEDEATIRMIYFFVINLKKKTK